MDKRTFGINLAKARDKKGISAYELSMRLEKDPTYISKIENGKAYPSMGVFFQICELLEIKATEIINQ